MKQFACLLILLCMMPVFAAKTPADTLAAAVLAKAGIRATVCEMPHAGNGTLAAALALTGVAQVHALASDEKAAVVARKPAVAAGVMGTQVIIETGSPNVLPLGDWVADLYLVTDATDVNLKTVSAAEAARVLSPYRGVAVVGNPAGVHGNLSKPALAAWAKDTGGTVTVTDDASGLWAVIKMPPLTGGDDWGHYYHGPDGNPVSKDTAFVATDYQMQWSDAPYQGERNYTVVVAGGRMFVASCTLYDPLHAGLRPQAPYELTARSLYNAQVLWRRPISALFGDMGSLLVATPDRLYAKEEQDVLVLDPETGVELSRIHTTTAPQVVRWITLSDGVVLTMSGLRPFVAAIDGPGPKGESEIERVKRTGTESLKRESAQELVAWDAASGKQLWRFTDGNIAMRKSAVSAGKAFLYVNDSYVTALDLRTGKVCWKTDAPPLDRSLVDADRRGDLQAVATPKAYVLVDPSAKQWVAFDATDGHFLWNLAERFTHNIWLAIKHPLVLADKIVSGEAVDLLTGKNLASLNPLSKNPYDDFGSKSDSCGHATAVESGLWIGNGIFDMKSGQQLASHLAKSPCGIGFFVADGTEVQFSSPCSCSYIPFKGTNVTRAVSRRPTPDETRLEQGEALAKHTAASADASDWPTYRSDETRKGSSAAVIPTKAAIRWTYIPARPEASIGVSALPEWLQNEVAATQVVAVGNLVWFGTSEGAVVCLDQKLGAEKWRYWTAGKIKSSPTWYAGRVYAGSADGWVYCLDADTGTLCWRYRVAPEQRRIDLYGGLCSAWPVWSDVLAHEGAIYVAAGFRGMLDGSALCALDARTGVVKWQKVLKNTGTTNEKGSLILEAPSGGGQMAWYQGKIWWNGIEVPPTVIDPATGDTKPATRFPNMDFCDAPGQDIGIIPGGWVAMGGLPPTKGGGGMDPFSANGSYGSPAVLMRSNPDGVPPFASKDGVPDVATTPHLWRLAGTTEKNSQQLQRTRVSRQIPLWDATEILLPGDFSEREKQPPMLCRGLIEALNAADDARPHTVEEIKQLQSMGAYQFQAFGRLYSPLDLPEANRRQVFADDLSKMVGGKKLRLSGQMLLASNAVIATAALDEIAGDADLNNWHAIAVNRTDRTVLWDVSLPVAPGLSGMSLTRGGDVLIPLIDGRIVCIGDGATQTPIPAVAVAATQPGLLVRGYASDAVAEGFSSWTPAIFDIIKPARTDVTPGLSIRQKKEDMVSVLRLDGYLDIPTTGLYHFTRSGDNGTWGLWGSFTLFDASGKFVVVATTSYQGQTDPVLLEQGKHPITAIVLQGRQGMNFNVQWEGPDLKRGDIPATALWHVPVQGK